MFEDLILEYETLVANMNEGIGGRILDKIVPGRAKRKASAAKLAGTTARLDREDAARAGAGKKAGAAAVARYNRQRIAKLDKDDQAQAKLSAKQTADKNRPKLRFGYPGSSRRTHGDWTPSSGDR